MVAALARAALSWSAACCCYFAPQPPASPLRSDALRRRVRAMRQSVAMQLLERCYSYSSPRPSLAPLAVLASVLLPLANMKLVEPAVLAGRCQRSFERATGPLAGGTRHPAQCVGLRVGIIKTSAIGNLEA